MAEGTVKWFSHEKGYGFIQLEDDDLFLHYSAIRIGDFKDLAEGNRVEFEVTQGERGPQAEDVRLVRP